MSRDEKITAEQVISKLKDDGDFDRLRFKIVRQLKQNEDLRNNIISVVKQSTVLNRPGAENMQTRKLCDAIYEEIREKAMSQISDGLWEIIRSGDDMKTEIKETVHSVYDKLLNPERKAIDSTSSSGQVPISRGTEFNGHVIVSGESNGIMSNGEHKEVSGFSLHNSTATNNHDLKPETQQPHPGNNSFTEEGIEPHWRNGPLQSKKGDSSSPPGYSSSGKRKRASDADADADEDPDIPPGFG
ncbi:uncharacterized protein LOC110702544 [Chenopodium quinoa]|uniref:BOD1/SHG1 domain-containing protein n=1 Tax=Chenopodium quinoa TaxID=63459 RepID=A0A803LQW0_CHEQI|nr:uncharacterized protein LOC110702544 [Chenopodium quinoa]